MSYFEELTNFYPSPTYILPLPEGGGGRSFKELSSLIRRKDEGRS